MKNYNLFFLIFISLLCSCVHSSKESTTSSQSDNKTKSQVIERLDFAAFAQSVLCNQGSLELRDLWKNNIYDAQVVGYFDKDSNLDSLRAKAIKAANLRGYNSYAVGNCSNNRSWYAILPAPQSYSEFKSENTRCDKISYLFAPSKTLQVKELRSVSSANENGVVAVNCHKNNNSQIWYMVPSKSGPNRDLIFKETIENLGKKFNTEQATLDWLNKVRQKAGFSQLTFQYVSNEYINQLSYSDFNHKPEELIPLRKTLETKYGVLLIGENRVVAQNLDRALWQLWNSPSHRQLLLNKSLQTLYVRAIQSDKNLTLFMLGFSKI